MNHKTDEKRVSIKDWIRNTKQTSLTKWRWVAEELQQQAALGKVI